MNISPTLLIHELRKLNEILNRLGKYCLSVRFALIAFGRLKTYVEFEKCMITCSTFT